MSKQQRQRNMRMATLAAERREAIRRSMPWWWANMPSHRKDFAWRSGRRWYRKPKFVMLRDPKDTREQWRPDDDGLWHLCQPVWGGSYCGASMVYYTDDNYGLSLARPSGHRVCKVCDAQRWRPAVSKPQPSYLSFRHRKSGVIKVDARALKHGKVKRLA